MERDPASNWVKEYSGRSYCYNERSEPHNCTNEEIEENLSHSDFVNYRRELVGLVDKNASSTPSFEIEKEMVYLQSGILALNDWQGCLYANTSDRMTLLRKVPELRARANLYARKIMELRSHHLVSHLFIARVQELSGYGLPSEVAARIPAGAWYWNFTFNPSLNSGTHFLHDFRGVGAKIATLKRGGKAIETIRAICGALIGCFGGIRGNDELAVPGLNNLVGLQVIAEGGTAKIAGLHERLFRAECGSGGIFDSTSGAYNSDCGKQYVKLDGWKEIY